MIHGLGGAGRLVGPMDPYTVGPAVLGGRQGVGSMWEPLRSHLFGGGTIDTRPAFASIGEPEVIRTDPTAITIGMSILGENLGALRLEPPFEITSAQSADRWTVTTYLATQSGVQVPGFVDFSGDIWNMYSMNIGHAAFDGFGYIRFPIVNNVQTADQLVCWAPSFPSGDTIPFINQNQLTLTRL